MRIVPRGNPISVKVSFQVLQCRMVKISLDLLFYTLFVETENPKNNKITQQFIQLLSVKLFVVCLLIYQMRMKMQKKNLTFVEGSAGLHSSLASVFVRPVCSPIVMVIMISFFFTEIAKTLEAISN